MVKSYKKLLSIIFAVIFIFTGCVKNNSNENLEEKEDKGVKEEFSSKKTIYATFFPVAELARMVVGDKMDVETIIKANEEPHSFELTSQDMKNILKADLIAYNGAGMEAFIGDLKESIKDDGKFLDLSEGLTLLDSSKEGSDLASINPHTWLSIRNAKKSLENIYEKVSALDPENEGYYRENYDKAKGELDDLDKKFEEELSKIKDKDKYFVVSHAAFNYLADDYGLKQVAVTGISPEDEPTAKELKTIADFVKDKNISTIFFEGKATPKVAETLAKNTDTKTSTLYTMENLSEDEMDKGYIGLMEENLRALVDSFDD